MPPRIYSQKLKCICSYFNYFKCHKLLSSLSLPFSCWYTMEPSGNEWCVHLTAAPHNGNDPACSGGLMWNDQWCNQVKPTVCQAVDFIVQWYKGCSDRNLYNEYTCYIRELAILLIWPIWLVMELSWNHSATHINLLWPTTVMQSSARGESCSCCQYR